MTDGPIVKIEEFYLRPGCPPEHLRQLVRTVDAPADITGLLACLRGRSQPRSYDEDLREGGLVREFVVTYENGKVERFLDRSYMKHSQE